MRTSDFDYHLPPELIAQTPLEQRDESRLLVLDRGSGQTQHRNFRDLLEYLRPGDVMVFNQSRVIQARVRGRRADTGGRVEFLLLREESPGVWQALARPGRRLRPGSRVVLGGGPDEQPAPGAQETGDGLVAEVLDSHDDGTKTIRLPGSAAGEGLARVGSVPLPPYIHRRLDDAERYQTVYGREPGSAAAPTAGLHFTEELLEDIRGLGVETVFVTLHVGLDTFRPVQGEDPAEHEIHTEYFRVDQGAADSVSQAKREGRRVIAVGTTSVRVLEGAASRAPGSATGLEAQSGWASLFILPGHRFRMVDAMITNFHLPRSTLLMLVSAFAGQGQGPGAETGAGLDMVLSAYQEAIDRRYRFYSFGDAMLML